MFFAIDGCLAGGSGSFSATSGLLGAGFAFAPAASSGLPGSYRLGFCAKNRPWPSTPLLPEGDFDI